MERTAISRFPRARRLAAPASFAPRLQAKLEVGAPDDEYEREADRVAEQVTRVAASPVSPSPPRVQRACACGGTCSSCREEEETVRRSPSGTSAVAAEAPSSVHDTLRSPGQPLGPASRAYFEPRFGHDFSRVRVHTGSHAAESARAVSARAYTVGPQIVFAPGHYAPGTPAGDRLLAHELTHVVQQSGSPARLQRDKGDKKTEEEPEPPNPLADWQLSTGSLLLVHTDNQLLVIPGGKLVWIPDAKGQSQFEAAKGHLTTDLGTLFEVPASGASGTRIFKAGKRTALILDAGSNPLSAVPSAVYLSEFQAIMSTLGVTKLEKAQIIHAHKDHVSEVANLVAQYNVKSQDLIIPKPYVGTTGGVTAELRTLITALQTTTDAALVTAGYGSTWRPGTTLKGSGAAGDVFRYSYKAGDLVIENIALKSALQNVTTKTADRASYLTKVTRTTDQAKVVVLGDLRGVDLSAFQTAMEAQRTGAWNEFFSGVTTISGFSHHVGAMTDRDVAGIISVLDATLLKTGKLRVVEQTFTGEQSKPRAETIEAARRLGIELVTTEMPAATGTSAAGATKASVYGRGPSATQHATITSDLTAALGRIQRLITARDTIQKWQPWFEEIGGKKAVEDILPQIDQSIRDLGQAARQTAEATLRVRTGGTQLTGGGRDYSAATGGTRATALDTALRAIPGTTTAETNLGTRGFELLDSLRRRPEKDIPLAVAIHAAMTRGEYSEKAFRHMLSAIDPKTRDSLLLDPRGGPAAKVKTFERVRAAFHFQSAVLGTGGLSVPAHLSPGGKAGVRGVGGFLAFLEIFNSLIVPAVQAYQTSQHTYSSRNLVPFLRRLLFWQQAGVAPKAVGVDEGALDQTYEKDYAKVIDGLNKNDLDALYFEEPGLSDADVFRFGIWLSYNIRNFDEFAVLFKDTGQDAVTWDSPKGTDWRQAKWKVRVGRYETSGENHVVESWYDHPKLTELMQVFASRVIANTEELLKIEASLKPASADKQAQIGYLSGYSGRARIPAKLKTPADSTEVEVDTMGNDLRSSLKKTVTWWSPPQFYVVSTSGDRAEVMGADYNTYANLRGLETENRTLGLGQYGSTHSVDKTGNLTARVWIHLSLLEGTGVQQLRQPAPKGVLSPP